MSYEELIDELLQQEASLEEIKEIQMQNLEQCNLCGTDLQYTHDIDYILQKVVEQPHCPGCGIKPKKNTHVLQ